MRCGHFKAAEGHNFAHFGARNESFRDASSEIDSLGELRELDWLRLKVTLCLLRAASAHSDPNPIVLNLIKLDAFTKRYRLHQLPGLLESKVPSLLLDLSLADHHKIRALSLSILSNLTALIPDFLYQFDPMAIADSVHCNLLHPFFPGRSCVFLWLGNILKSYPDLLPHLTDRVPLADISDSAVELVVQDETKFVTYFFCHFAQLARSSPDVFGLCRDVFYFFFRKAVPSPTSSSYSVLTRCSGPSQSRRRRASSSSRACSCPSFWARQFEVR
jgi:hypothetical protein